MMREIITNVRWNSRQVELIRVPSVVSKESFIYGALTKPRTVRARTASRTRHTIEFAGLETRVHFRLKDPFWCDRFNTNAAFCDSLSLLSFCLLAKEPVH